MNKVILTARVNPQGTLNLNVPLRPEDADKPVRVTVEPLDEAAAPPGLPTTREEWLKFIAATAGSIGDPTFERAPQGEYEQRDAFP